ncbi:type III-B CRISPR-associated protein Cas10/Cmr2 [Myxococcus sp. CA033]|uniref:type III-B CRISPR-associated protein Cas10/Cmr2 n=1 Tax=Myxococcus sp. CA033 TaxID=2741516 RepID=UPI00157A63DF|nr:type III-B CRISPR-associated protein Cas10/Cmr2 [Myxococcus sp. CA033]NTX41319.1 type III-B CRISPR-associated protein Cas10/Cmr2 [Myxococcus sp. CA033]
MTAQTHVLVLKVGPVQGFIIQSRRTRDLWFGSDLLSRLSRAMALALLSAGAELIFPHPEQLTASEDAAPNLGSSRKVTSEGAEPVRGFPNKVLALVRGGDPEAVARSAREAALKFLRDTWVLVREKCAPLLLPGANEWAQEQLDTFLEFHAAWVPQHGDAYEQALEEVEAALEARRALREFKAWTKLPPAGTHKSSLDGGRPSVLRRERPKGGEWKGLRIGEREELDALGLLKRAGGDPDQFVPVPGIGLAAWLDKARQAHPRELADLTRACAELKFTRGRRAELPWVKAFPFDGQLLLPERWQPYFEEVSEPETARHDAASFGARYVLPLRKVMDVEPYPYVACLVADGDRMGETLRRLAAKGGWEAHRKVSHALASFTAEARELVQVKHRGMLVYAGGDDVLAFVCPPDAPACARALATAFQRNLEPVLAGTGVDLPTLSVGLGIGHVLESLGQLLNLGRRAEKAAKDAGRDALAILVAKHAGRERLWTSGWKSNPEPLTRLKTDMALLSSGRLPLSKVHEVEAMARRFPAEVSEGDSEAQSKVLVFEVERILARAEAGRNAKDLSLDEVGLAGLAGQSGRAVHACLHAWVSRLLVAETLERAGRKLELENKDGAA